MGSPGNQDHPGDPDDVGHPDRTGQPDRLDHLRQVKLGALVGDRWGKSSLRGAFPRQLPGGAALIEPSAKHAWVLIDDGDPTRLGSALMLATSQRLNSLDVLVEGSPSGAGVVARRADFFPNVQVWQVRGRSLEPVTPVDLLDDDDEPDPVTVAVLESHGLEAIFEHGVLRGEILGLEVARTVGGRLEVGVGRYDRSARTEMRPAEDVHAALDEAAAAVRRLRRPNAPPHPANTLARSRWLRSLACSHPDSLGLAGLAPVAPPLPWFDLTEVASSPALGTRPSGEQVVAVFSVGVDPDLVPTAADCYAHYARSGAGLWLAIPEGDDLPVVRSLVSTLRIDAEIHLVPRKWETLGGHHY